MIGCVSIRVQFCCLFLSDSTSLPGEVGVSLQTVTSTSFHIVWHQPEAQLAIELSWNHPPAETITSSITDYTLVFGESDGSSPAHGISLSGEVKEHTVTGLKPHTQYYVKVAAKNSAGRGPFCEPVLVQTAPDSEC